MRWIHALEPLVGHFWYSLRWRRARPDSAPRNHKRRISFFAGMATSEGDEQWLRRITIPAS
jgi:hypothetical protein